MPTMLSKPQTETREQSFGTASAEPVRYFEATVLDTSGKYSAHLFAIPPNCLPRNRSALNVQEIADSMGLTLLQPLKSLISLPYALTALLLSADSEQVVRDFANLSEYPPEKLVGLVEKPIELFAQQIAFGKIVPLEASPLDLHSLASLASGGGAVGSGLVIGIAVAAGHPLLLVTAPVGIVLVVAAPQWGKKVGKIGELLLDKVIDWIKKK